MPSAGSEPPDTPQRPFTSILQSSTSGSGTSRFTANGVGGVGVGVAEGAVTYDLRIDSTEETRSLDASTSADTLHLASIGVVGDIAP